MEGKSLTEIEAEINKMDQQSVVSQSLGENPTMSEKVTHYFAQMNTEAINVVLHHLDKLQDLDREFFLFKLRKSFSQLRDKGESSLLAFPGVCMGCSKGCGGFTFLGPKSRDYIDMVYMFEGEKITDIYECVNLENDMQIPKNERVYIQKLNTDWLKGFDYDDPDRSPF